MIGCRKIIKEGYNKESSSYFLYSGANSHFFTVIPYNSKPAIGTVITAGGSKELIVGAGEHQIGNLKPDRVHPTMYLGLK
jgi:hypothetical protein